MQGAKPELIWRWVWTITFALPVEVPADILLAERLKRRRSIWLVEQNHPHRLV
jgi:hypothetical protein